jgi:bla regulator protein BlaR1
MLNFLIYLLEVSVLTSIFYMFYRYLYFKLAYFEFCRYYFFILLIISFILPLVPSVFSMNAVNLKLETLFTSEQSKGLHSINYIHVKDSFLHRENTLLAQIPIVKVLMIIWISGFVRYAFIISKNIYSVLILIRSGKRKKDGIYTIVKTNSKNSAFTFFRHIFINDAFDLLDEKEKEQIMNHEKIHAKQLHSIDNLLFELMRAVLWFNPLSKVISANIKIVHEFIVDNQLTENKNMPDYSRLILKMAVHNSHALSVSHFSSEEIKNRIKLISYPESQKIRKRRFNGSIPVLGITVFAAYLIMSTVNMYAKDKAVEETLFTSPFKKGSYQIITPFFENKSPGEVYKGYEQSIEINENIKLSHKESAYEVKSFSEVYAIGSGHVSHIQRDKIMGLEEVRIEIHMENDYRVIYKGLYKTILHENDEIEKGETIGLAGDIRLYPTIKIQLFHMNKAVDPEIYY